jgi:regulator of cell morphogenesis and NO signaling
MHLMKEEMMLFPYIERMEEAVLEKSPMLPPPFGTVRNPVSMMMHEHDGAGEALRELRAASNGYAAPPDACASYRALYQALAGFEADLHQHIHLENNILFPRAIEMERAAARPL